MADSAAAGLSRSNPDFAVKARGNLEQRRHPSNFIRDLSVLGVPDNAENCRPLPSSQIFMPIFFPSFLLAPLWHFDDWLLLSFAFQPPLL